MNSVLPEPTPAPPGASPAISPTMMDRQGFKEALDRTISGQNTGFLAIGRRKNLDDHFEMVRPEFAGTPEIAWVCAQIIIRIRREIDLPENWGRLRYLMDADELRVPLIGSLNTRWIIAICDTYADRGTREEKLAAMNLVVLINTIKLAESERLVLNDTALDPEKFARFEEGFPHTLWDGVTSYRISRGEMPHNLFQRLLGAMEPVPPFREITVELLDRLRRSKDGNLFGRLGELNSRFW